MKKTLLVVLTVLAVLFACVSCKEEVPEVAEAGIKLIFPSSYTVNGATPESITDVYGKISDDKILIELLSDDVPTARHFVPDAPTVLTFTVEESNVNKSDNSITLYNLPALEYNSIEVSFYLSEEINSFTNKNRLYTNNEQPVTLEKGSVKSFTLTYTVQE